jgi:DNA-binding TFAR19-related protein (PDSD5 family)
VATITVGMINGTAPNPVVGLLDMVVFSTLKRQAVEEYWLPNLLGDEGKGIAVAHRRGEDAAWEAAGRVLTPSQCNQLRDLIEEWRRGHPGQYYVGQTRFSDFDAYRNLTPDSPQAKTPGSLFSLFYVDPLAGLDPVARELRSYRALTERMMFMVSRLPVLAAYQVDLAAMSATGTPEVRAFVAATDKFADATSHFANVTAGYPAALSAERQAAVKQLGEVTARERQAAIEQASRAVAAERETLLKQIEAQDGRIRAILADVSQLVARAEQAGTTVNASTAQTINSTEQATRRTMDQAFRLSLILLLVILLGVPAVLLAYRVANRRLLGTTS